MRPPAIEAWIPLRRLAGEAIIIGSGAFFFFLLAATLGLPDTSPSDAAAALADSELQPRSEPVREQVHPASGDPFRLEPPLPECNSQEHRPSSESRCHSGY